MIKLKYFKIKYKENLKYMLILMFMFNTSFLVDIMPNQLGEVHPLIESSYNHFQL